jgi:hypothetical protein
MPLQCARLHAVAKGLPPVEPLEPEVLAFLDRRHGLNARHAVAREPLTSADSATGARLERLIVSDDAGRQSRYVIKRLRPLGDWIARATGDTRVREYQIATGGVLGALPEGLATPVVGSLALADGSFALIMRDVADGLPPSGDDPLTAEQVASSLRVVARLHTTFFGFPARLTAGLGLCHLARWLTMLAPATGDREADMQPRDPVTPLLRPGWDAFARQEPAAWEQLAPLLALPARLIAALRELPATLLHGDVKAANVAFEDGRVLLLDWGLALRGPGALDLGLFLAVNSAKLPMERDATIELYRAERERLGRLPATGELWERELALGLLAGTMRLGWAKALGAESADPVIRQREQAELTFWARSALAAQRWL